MAATSRRSSGTVQPISSTFRRSISPSGRFAAASATAFATSSSSFSSTSSAFFHHRSASPTRVNLVGFAPPAPSVRFSLPPHRATSPGRSLSAAAAAAPSSSPSPSAASGHRKSCMCSPTTHPGSFRCSLHKGIQNPHRHHHQAFSSPSNRLNAQRSAMTNSLVRIGAVEGDWVKRALAALIRPSSHQQRRRTAFQPRPSRLSIMSCARSPRSISADP